MEIKDYEKRFEQNLRLETAKELKKWLALNSRDFISDPLKILQVGATIKNDPR